MNYKPGICTFCGTGCGHLLDVSGEEVRGVFPVQNHPVSKGRLCVRGWHVHELLNSSEKITSPLVRKEGVLVETGYDEAISFLVEKLAAHKRESSDEIAFLASPRSSNEENFLLMKLARSVFNANNISLDCDPGHRISIDVMRQGTGMAGMLGSLEEIAESEFIMTVGIDITKQNPIIGSEIHKAARSGAKLVVLDTRATQIAKLSGKFLHARPGAYRIAAAFMAKVLLDEGLCDMAYIKRNTEGYEAFSRSLSTLGEGEVAEKTGLEPNELRETARELAAAGSAMVFFSSGISGLDKDTVGILYNLFLLAGKVGRKGCGVNPVTGINNLQGSYDMGIAPDLLTGYQSLEDTAVREKYNKEWGVKLPAKPGAPIHDMTAVGGKLKALVVVDHDETIIRNLEMIRNTDFVAYIGTYRNAFTDLADVVLPIASYIESDATFTNTERRVQLSRKKLDPPGGVLPGWKLISAIAEKAGAKWGYGSPAEVMNEIAKLTPSYSGISHAKLQGTFGIQWPCGKDMPNGTARFNAEDAAKKVSFAPVDGGFSVPRTSEEFPMLRLVGEAQHYWHQNNLMKKTNIPLREYNATLLLYPEGYVAISPEDAKELQVRDRFPVKVVSPYGSMEAMVQVTDKLKPKTAYAAYFVHDMATKFFLEHRDVFKRGEDATIPVRIVKV
ncbi:MAG: hypothetical protein E4G96_06225 [Chrysiogenales bacterium]|nr:MAG: hypothetical protein E4G96_06225 [Chrysiogenales bacterium]